VDDQAKKPHEIYLYAFWALPMNKVLQGLEQFATCYIDVHSCSNTWEHVKHVREVLERLKKFGLTVNSKKYVWGVAAIDYLGYIVGRGKVRIPELRVSLRLSCRCPRTRNWCCPQRNQIWCRSSGGILQ
jgi:hypothetical protein